MNHMSQISIYDRKLFRIVKEPADNPTELDFLEKVYKVYGFIYKNNPKKMYLGFYDDKRIDIHSHELVGLSVMQATELIVDRKRNWVKLHDLIAGVNTNAK